MESTRWLKREPADITWRNLINLSHSNLGKGLNYLKVLKAALFCLLLSCYYATEQIIVTRSFAEKVAKAGDNTAKKVPQFKTQ
jgi:hypothetical protein